MKILTFGVVLLVAALAVVALLQTGQRTRYASGDDNDIRVGMAWPYPRFTVGKGAEGAGKCIARTPTNAEIRQKTHDLQIPFIANEEQVDKRVRFYVKTFGGTVFITKDGQMVYSLPKYEASGNENLRDKNVRPMNRWGFLTPPGGFSGKEKVQGWVIRESLAGASIPYVKGEEQATTRVSYFKGNDPSRWRRNISTYELVSLGEVYEGVELKLKAYGNNIEKLFTVKPGANPEKIRVKVEGAEGIKVNEAGELEVETDLGVVKFNKPSAYQEEDGKRKYVEVAYAVEGDEYRFKVGDYDRTKGLVIDPLLASTFFGGGYWDGARSISLDSSGNVYVAGRTSSSDFPTIPGAYDTTFNGGSDAFASKLDRDLSAIPPLSDIKANGSDEQINIISRDPLVATISLDPGVKKGEKADWWLAVATPFGLYWYNGTAWTPSASVAYQGPLVDIDPFEILNITGLPVGTYTIYFGVDLSMDGVLNEPIYYDNVVISVR